jgi:hypothetical protein
MKPTISFVVLTALTFLAVGTAPLHAADTDGVALAIIYDTSGSMREAVRDTNGQQTAKYVIANRALVAVARQIQAFATPAGGAEPRKVEAALFVFQGDGGRQAIKFGPFEAAAFESWAGRFNNPSGNTPLGNTLTAATRAVLASPLTRKHVLVITDGVNTAGPTPSAVLPGLKRQAEEKQTGLSVHFVAFDVDAKVFDGVKRLGATVVGAADETQLNSQLQFILQRKILLEDEEPKK